MQYSVQFQEFNPKSGRPIDEPCEADFKTTDSGMIPQVGDIVNIIARDPANSPAYSGRVKSRLFTYFGDNFCGITIVVEPDDNIDWGKLIKE